MYFCVMQLGNFDWIFWIHPLVKLGKLSSSSRVVAPLGWTDRCKSAVFRVWDSRRAVAM